jgi:activator of HSP90 ATPase
MDEEKIKELLAENEMLKRENRELKKNRKGMLQTHSIEELRRDDGDKRRTVLTTNEKALKTKTLLQTHGRKVQSPEERAKAILEAVLEKRAKAKEKKR